MGFGMGEMGYWGIGVSGRWRDGDGGMRWNRATTSIGVVHFPSRDLPEFLPRSRQWGSARVFNPGKIKKGLLPRKRRQIESVRGRTRTKFCNSCNSSSSAAFREALQLTAVVRHIQNA